jgi:hypothetical protein
MFDHYGKIEGFYGLSRGGKYIERPFGMDNFQERGCPTELPYWTPSWWRLTTLIPPRRREGLDPYVLYDDRTSTILHVWNQEYPPSYVEVMQVCTQLLEKQRSH